MKRLMVLLLTGVTALGLMACGGETAATDNTAATEAADNTAAEAEATMISGTYTVSYNVNNGNVEEMPSNQFLGADMSGIVSYDSRLYVDITLDLDGNGNYTLVSDCYVVEADERQEVGAESGIGQTWTMTADGTYSENADGTVTTAEASNAALVVSTDTYSSQIKDAVGFSINDSSDDGEFSGEEIAALVPETVWTLEDGAIVSYTCAETEEEAETEVASDSDAAESAEALIEIPSDDQGTSFTLNSDGTYTFYFESYDISDMGTYEYADGVLTVTDKNGVSYTSETDGDNVKFHYAYSDSDQLTGDYTVLTSDLEAALN